MYLLNPIIANIIKKILNKSCYRYTQAVTTLCKNNCSEESLKLKGKET